MYATLRKITLTSSRFFLLPAASLIVLVLLSLSVGPICAETGAVDTADGVDSVDCCYKIIGDYVWFDMNGNGLQDEEPEAGINGIDVTLWRLNDDGSTTWMGSTTTANDAGNPGYYYFNNIRDERDYIVEFELPPDGTWIFTAKDQGTDDRKDSDADPTTGQTASFYLVCANNKTLDAGLIRIDLGDLPINYLMVHKGVFNSIDENGARHIVWDMDGDAVPDQVDAVWLGTIVDSEVDATHCPLAQSDDTLCTAGAGLDDEDGVTFDASKWVPGADPNNTLEVTVSGRPPATEAYFVGWVDWNGINGFSDPGDFIVEQWVDVGSTTIGFNAPLSGPYSEILNMRFRLFDKETALSLGAPAPDSRSSSPASMRGFDLTDAMTNAYHGLAVNGEVEDYQATNGSLPVTLSYFLATREEAVTHFIWQTATEIGVAGFNLLADMEGGLQTLNPELIPSPVIDSVEPIDYEYSTTTPATIFYLQESCIDGSMSEHGPYEVGVAYGIYTESSQHRNGGQLFLPLIVR